MFANFVNFFAKILQINLVVLVTPGITINK